MIVGETNSDIRLEGLQDDAYVEWELRKENGGDGVFEESNGIDASFMATAPGRIFITANGWASMQGMIDGSSDRSADSCLFSIRAEAPTDAGTDTDAGFADAGAQNADAGFIDAGAPSCASAIAPVAAFDVSTINGPASQLIGPVCGDPNAITTLDGVVFGLARESGALGIDLEPNDGVDRIASACVGADFGTVQDILEVVVYAQAVGEACGDTCTDGVCGTGNDVAAYGSEDGDNYTFIYGAPDVPHAGVGAVSIARSARLRYLLVCRTGQGWARDNIEVDYVELCP